MGGLSSPHFLPSKLKGEQVTLSHRLPHTAFHGLLIIMEIMNNDSRGCAGGDVGAGGFLRFSPTLHRHADQVSWLTGVNVCEVRVVNRV